MPDAERERVSAIYGGYAADPARQRRWRSDDPGNVAIRRELLAAVVAELPAAGPILDAGCGTGWLLAALAARGRRTGTLHGTDILEARVARAAAAVPGAALAVGDVRALPYADGTFAAVVLLTVLSSLSDAEDVRAAGREVRRVLAPGGVAVVWEPRVVTPGNRATRLVRPGDLEPVLGPVASTRPITLLPPLARRLGRAAPRLYPVLGRLPGLRSHRLIVFRPARTNGQPGHRCGEAGRTT